jgi:K+-transporting ATPase KdpF subunit
MIGSVLYWAVRDEQRPTEGGRVRRRSGDGGPGIHGGVDPGVRRAGAGRGRDGSTVSAVANLAGLVLAALAVVYLVVALIHPERF